jgi:phage terminase small subunit
MMLAPPRKIDAHHYPHTPPATQEQSLLTMLPPGIVDNMAGKRPIELNERQKRFVAAYVKNANATQAYIEAGYSAANAAINASRLMSNDMVKKAIEAQTKKHLDDLDITNGRILREVANAAFATGADLIDFTGPDWKLRPANEVPPDAQRTITDVEVIRNEDGSERIKIKRQSKDANLERLMRYRRLLGDAEPNSLPLMPIFVVVPNIETLRREILHVPTTISPTPGPVDEGQ